MPKLDVLSLFTVAAAVETREFTDPQQPGAVLILTLKRPEFPDYALAQERAAELAAVWVPTKERPHPPPWPPPPAEPIRWSNRLCQVLGLLEALQSPEQAGDFYDALDLAVLSVRMPSAWEGLSAWVQELERSYQATPGNGSAAREETSSAPPATLVELTPASTTITPTLSGA